MFCFSDPFQSMLSDVCLFVAYKPDDDNSECTARVKTTHRMQHRYSYSVTSTMLCCVVNDNVFLLLLPFNDDHNISGDDENSVVIAAALLSL